jgi:hypothetical protein
VHLESSQPECCRTSGPSHPRSLVDKLRVSNKGWQGGEIEEL